MIRVTNYNCIKLNGQYELNDCTAFENEKYVFLYDNISGHSVILQKNIWSDILKGTVEDGIIFVLHQRGFFERKIQVDVIEEKPQPTFFLINMTDCCNLRCKYCFRDVHEKIQPNISNHEVINICTKILAYCHKFNVRNINIQPWGGEPLLSFEQIILIDEFMKQSDVSYKIIFATNATLISEEIAREIEKRDFRVGISLDGNEDLHNVQRPFKNGIKNSYLSVKNGVENLYKSGYDNIGAICTISKLNIEHVDEIIDTFVNDFNIHSIKMNFTKSNPFSIESQSIAVSDEETISKFYDSLIDKIILLNESGYNIFERNIYDKLLNLLSDNTSNICLARGCLGGNKMVSINRKGDIFPCEMVDVKSVKMGNIFENYDLVDIINKSKEDNPFFKCKIVDKCTKCNWKVFCGGGCSASVIYSECSDNCCDELECRINQVLYPKLINLILNKPNAIFYLSNKSIKII